VDVLEGEGGEGGMVRVEDGIGHRCGCESDVGLLEVSELGWRDPGF